MNFFVFISVYCKFFFKMLFLISKKTLLIGQNISIFNNDYPKIHSLLHKNKKFNKLSYFLITKGDY